jgi:hypothetical protein
MRVFVKPNVDSRYRLAAPTLTLGVEYGDGTVVVSDRFSTVYGVGSDTDKAIGDYLRSLFDYFEKLESREAVLARGLRRELAALRRYVVPHQ